MCIHESEIKKAWISEGPPQPCWTLGNPCLLAFTLIKKILIFNCHNLS